jgi:uncharacterized protein (TIGR03083 family)
MSLPGEIPYHNDPLTVRAALAGQVEAIRSTVHALTAEELDRPTRLDGWTVRELVAHLGIVLDWVPRYLDAPVPEGEPLALVAWVGVTRTAAATIKAGVQEYAADAFAGPPAAVAAEFDVAADALLRVLAGPAAAEPGRRIAMRFGPMLLDDYLVTRLVEAVVHADDLAAALGVADFPHDRRAVDTVARLLHAAAARQRPAEVAGGADAADGAVQADPITWIRLATGRLSWAAAGDLPGWAESRMGEWLPVMG